MESLWYALKVASPQLAYRLPRVWPPAGHNWCFLVAHLNQMPYERPTFDRKEWHEKFLTHLYKLGTFQSHRDGFKIDKVWKRKTTVHCWWLPVTGYNWIKNPKDCCIHLISSAWNVRLQQQLKVHLNLKNLSWNFTIKKNTHVLVAEKIGRIQGKSKRMPRQSSNSFCTYWI
jgi:hypothetical protein